MIYHVYDVSPWLVFISEKAFSERYALRTNKQLNIKRDRLYVEYRSFIPTVDLLREYD